MKIKPRFPFTGVSLELPSDEAIHLSMICLHYNRTAGDFPKERLNVSVKVMQGLDQAPRSIETDEE